MRMKSIPLFTIFTGLWILLIHTGFWFMPNIPAQYAISQSLDSNPLSNPAAHYLYTNYLEPALFGLLGGKSLHAYLLYTFGVSLAFVLLFMVWFRLRRAPSDEPLPLSTLTMLLFPVFSIPFYWVGMDGMTLLLMLLTLLCFSSGWSLLFAILLGMQHFEQGVAAFLLLLVTLLIHGLLHGEWRRGTIRRILTVLLAILLGKILLSFWFHFAGIELLEGRSDFLRRELGTFVQRWVQSWPAILYSLFGVGWLIVLRHFRSLWPLTLAALIVFLFVAFVGDATRVGVILLFPSLFYWLFDNPEILGKITPREGFVALILYLSLPMVYVWRGHPYDTLLPYDKALIHALRTHATAIDFMRPFRLQPFPSFDAIEFRAGSLPTRTGHKHQNRIVVPDGSGPGLASFGPYVALPPGRYRFRITYRSGAPDSVRIGSWDLLLTFTAGSRILSAGPIFGTGGRKGEILSTFTISPGDRGSPLEIRTHYRGPGGLSLESLRIEKVSR